MSIYSRRHLKAARRIPAPIQAAQAGYRTLIFEDDFTSQSSIDVNSTGAPGYSWYIDRMNGWTPIDPKELTVNNSVLTITQTDTSAVNYAICTTSAVSNNGQAFRHFYAEARMRFEPSSGWPSIGGPAFWSLSTDDVWAYDSENTMKHWAELDFYEYVPGAYNGSVHDWWHTDPAQPKTDYVNSNTNYNPLPAGTDFSEWHTYGCLWTPGAIQYFFDDKPLATTYYSADAAPPQHPTYPIGTWSQLDAEPNGMTIILGSGTNWPTDIDWVRVWGQPTSLLRFDNRSPNPRLPFTATFELDTQNFRGLNSATVTRTTGEKHAGSTSLQLTHSSDIYSSASCEITRGLTPGATFNASCWIKSAPGGADTRFIIHFFTASRGYLGNVSTQVKPNGSWQQLSVTGTLPASVGLISVTIDKPGNSSLQSVVYVDDIVINYI